MSNPSDLIYIPSLNLGGWWTAYVTGWRWDGTSTEYAAGAKVGITDTGTSCLYGPSGIMNHIRD